MPENAKLTPWPEGEKGLPQWDSLGLLEKKLFIKQADVYGAYLAYADHEIGRVIQAVEDLGELDNTLIIYISGDNGASAEGMLNGTPNEFTTFNGVPVPVKAQYLWYPFWGSDKTFPHFAAEWAWAMDTPFKWVKQVPSHFGGTAQGVAMSWPGHIKDVGGIRRQFSHVIDIVPTILEATGIPAPETINGIKQAPIEGTSMMYTWDKANANAPTRHTTQYFEMLGNRAIYHDGWMASTTPVTLPWELSSAPPPDVITGYKWELYNLQEDPTQFNDLAAKMPEKVKEMQALFDSEAKKYNVLPLDNTTLPRWNTPRPSLTAGRTEFTYSGELTGVPASAAPSILNKSYTITAEVEIPKGGAEGMIVTEGGRFGGYGLFLSKGVAGIRGGKPVFLYNLLNLKRTIWSGPELGAGKHTIVFDFKSDGPGLGKGGTGVLSVDGKEVDRKSMEHTTPITFPEDETFDVGQDTRTGVAMLEYRYDVSVQVHRQDQQADLQARTGGSRRHRSPRPNWRPTAAPEPDPIEAPKRPSSFQPLPSKVRQRERLSEIGPMKKALMFAAVAEAATGLALLIVPSLVGQLLLGEELIGVAIPVARVAGIALIALGIACWPGPPLVGMLIYSAVVTLLSCLPRFCRWVDRRLSMAGGCASRSTVNPSRSRLARY